MLILQHPKQILTCQVLEYEANVVIVCESIVKFDNEVPVTILVKKAEYFLLGLYMVDTLLVCDTILLYSFQGSQLPIHYYQINRTVLSLPDIDIWIRVNILLYFCHLLSFLL